MKGYRILTAALAAGVLIFHAGCESRQHSIVRENGYLEDHPVEEVAHYWREVAYAEAGGETLTLDISAPEGPGPFPVLMIIHGGGWVLHTNTVMEGMSRYITNRGYVVFNINYRVTPDVSMETIVGDCLGALIWTKEHAAEYNGNPSRIAVTGDSAGGHLTAMLVTQANNPAFSPAYQGSANPDLSITCAIPSYGIFDFVGLGKKLPSLTKQWVGEKYKDAPERYDLLSPVNYLKAGLAPQLVIVGNRDFLYKENVEYVAAVEEAGSSAQLWVYPGQGHAFLNYYWDERGTKGYDRIIEFLDKHLK